MPRRACLVVPGIPMKNVVCPSFFSTGQHQAPCVPGGIRQSRAWLAGTKIRPATQVCITTGYRCYTKKISALSTATISSGFLETSHADTWTINPLLGFLVVGMMLDYAY